MFYKILRASLIGLLISAGLMLSYIGLTHHKHTLTPNEVREIYQQVLIQTGQSQDALPLVIDNNDSINAYNDGQSVHVFTGIIKFVNNKDELALVLGHEIAHGMLRHVYYPEFQTNELEISVAEANADKLGAVYMMKAGYDICKAREMWKRMSVMAGGDYQGGNHPTYSYRYRELNIGCE